MDSGRRRFLASGVAAAASALAPRAVRDASAAERPVLSPRRVGHHVWYVEGGAGVDSNAGFVVTDAGVVVIDALGSERLGHALVAAIGRVTREPVRRVIVTHYHADHVEGLGALKGLGAEIWAHAGARERVLRRPPAVVRADRWLDGDETFVLGRVTFDLLHVGPAHSPEDLVVMVRESHALFAGDLVFSARLPVLGEVDPRRWIAALDRPRPWEPRAMIPGHGPVSRVPVHDVTLTRDYLAHLTAVVSRAVAAGEPLEAAYARADWSRFSHLPAFDGANRRNAAAAYRLLESGAAGR